MTSEKIYEVIGEIDERYVKEAKEERKRKRVITKKVWATIAACVCLAVGGGIVLNNKGFYGRQDSEIVQIPNPLHEVSSLEEMEKYLGFTVPTLDKEAESYIVIDDGDFSSARIEYTDGSTFNMAKGTGDISGIYGGTFEKEQEFDNVKVSFYEYRGEENTIKYALWENDGFTCSYAGTEISTEEIQLLIQTVLPQ